MVVLLGIGVAEISIAASPEDNNAWASHVAPVSGHERGSAVETDVEKPPPAISFEPWRLVTSGDVSDVFEVTFPSAMTTEHEANNRVNLRVYMPSDRLGAVPVVILLHYWGATETDTERAMAEHLNRRGIAGIILALPYHMSRTPKGFRSGELAIQPDPARLVVTMTQSIWDVRRTIDWIQSQRELDAHRIGISGTSLGAIVASLAFGIDPRLKAGCFMLGGADLAHILWNSSRVVGEREALRRRGFTEERMREALRDIEPLNYLRPSDRPTFIVGAKHDTVIPPADVDKLIQALEPSDEGEPCKRPERLWLDTGHYGGVFVQRQLTRSMASFFDAALHGRDYRPPKSFLAPTLRIGFEVNPASGFQVAVGLDLWRWSRNADGFGALLLTPKGVQGFLGYHIGSGLALGITVLPKRTTVGAFWSAVL